MIYKALAAIFLFAVVVLSGLYFLARTEMMAVFDAPSNYMMGPADADLVVADFFDYGCDSCRQFNAVVMDVAKRDGRLKILPVLVDTGITREVSRFILYTYAAAEQGQMQAMHEKIIQEWPIADETVLIDYARQLGLDMSQFQADLDSQKLKDHIARNDKFLKDWRLYYLPAFVMATPQKDIKAIYIPATNRLPTADEFLERLGSLER
ncbi:MAG: DsbA family protein [Alphaproteobacteria bacterium]|nr:DsbA family protein [Alphaproteobacteria bacterium]